MHRPTKITADVGERGPKSFPPFSVSSLRLFFLFFSDVGTHTPGKGKEITRREGPPSPPSSSSAAALVSRRRKFSRPEGGREAGKCTSCPSCPPCLEEGQEGKKMRNWAAVASGYRKGTSRLSENSGVCAHTSGFGPYFRIGESPPSFLFSPLPSFLPPFFSPRQLTAGRWKKKGRGKVGERGKKFSLLLPLFCLSVLPFLFYAASGRKSGQTSEKGHSPKKTGKR